MRNILTVCIFTISHLYYLRSNGVKLLGAQAFPVASSEAAGDLIANSVISLLRKRNCTDKIATMVFDTTAANTGMQLNTPAYYLLWKLESIVYKYNLWNC